MRREQAAEALAQAKKRKEQVGWTWTCEKLML